MSIRSQKTWRIDQRLLLVFHCSSAVIFDLKTKATQMNQQRHRYQVGALPLVRHMIERLKLGEMLSAHMNTHANECIPAIETILLLVYNLVSPIFSSHDIYEIKAIENEQQPDFGCS